MAGRAGAIELQSGPAAGAWRWAALLGFALIAPVALPAGGGQRWLPELRRRCRAADPWFSQRAATLRAAPHRQAPVLRQLEPGAPLRVLRRWSTPGGRDWLRVEALADGSAPRRGWLAS